jgi:hypothetical protein
VYAFWAALRQELTKAANQRQALYEQLDRIAAKIDGLPGRNKE